MNKCGMNKNAIAMMLQKVAQTARLMVGVGDYPQYVAHMKLHHADAPVMSEREYFRHCQNSRYGGEEGSIKRCPC
ncbi:MAG: YbdD/YjiX family protein [Pseudomonadales bacterium]